MSNLTPPVDPTNVTFSGDLDIFDSLVASNGDGSIYVRNGGLYVEGLTDLDQTTISTADGEFLVSGPNKVNINISGGATSSVEILAEDQSFFTTTAGVLTLSSSASDANGKVNISAAGTGTNSVLVEATNVVSGQVTVQSAGGSPSSDAIRILASDSSDGNILIQGAGNDTAGNAAIKLDAPNATSGRILLTSAGDSNSSNSVEILASGSTDGNVLVQSNGTGNAVELFTNNASGKVYIHTTGTGTDSINVTTAGGTLIDAVGRVYIQSTNTADGVKIATATAGVPVTLGTSSSLTTISGNLTVEGTFTTINTESLAVEDNCILLNSGSGESGIDAGVVMRRYQTPNDAGSGDVSSNPDPIQETGAFVAGSSTPSTLVLGAHSSGTTDFYKGWWIKVTSGTGVDQIRRIKSYDSTTKTATLYITADNTTQFFDGLDLTTAPAAADTYNLYSRTFAASFYGESSDRITMASLANQPDDISAVGVSTAQVQQYQTISSGAHYIHDQVYNNALVSASGTTLTLTLRGHGEVVGNSVRLTNSSGLTPSLTSGIYVIATVPTANTFTVTAAASTTSSAASSLTVTSLASSALYVNNIFPFDADYPLQIAGLSVSEFILIPKTSVLLYTVTNSALFGTYIMHVCDTSGSGAMAVFSLASSGSGGSITRTAASRGDDLQRIQAVWNSGEKIKIFHLPAAIVGSGNYTYKVKLLPGF